jgi:protein CpxP
MNCSPKNMIAAAMLATLGLAAVAQTPPGQPPYGAGAASSASAPQQQGDRHDPAKRLERFAARMAKVKEKLQITPAQEGAWANWITAIQPSANLQRPDRAALEQVTTPQRIDQMRALRTQRSVIMDRRAEATKTFYAALTPAQQALFDAGAARMGRHGHGGHHH